MAATEFEISLTGSKVGFVFGTVFEEIVEFVVQDSVSGVEADDFTVELSDVAHVVLPADLHYYELSCNYKMNQ